jgi:hypothetical protein
MDSVVGSCSLCSGPVTVPSVWMAVIPPVPRCSRCGAVAASHGPVIPMRQPGRLSIGVSTDARPSILNPPLPIPFIVEAQSCP